MNESKQNLSQNFHSEEEAFEYLVQQSQNQVLKDKWREELEKLPDAPVEVKRNTRTVFFKRASAVAASFIILFGSFYWFTNQGNSPQQMASAMIHETNFVLESASLTRGLNGEDSDELGVELQKEINKALEKEDYAASVGLFLTKEKKSQLSIDDKFYYALSLARVENEDHHKAIRLLDSVKSQKAKYYNEALWLQALLYLKINEPNKSKIILNKLINNSNYQITNTKALLERMAN